MLLSMSGCQNMLRNQDIPFYSEWMRYIKDDTLIKEIERNILIS